MCTPASRVGVVLVVVTTWRQRRKKVRVKTKAVTG